MVVFIGTNEQENDLAGALRSTERSEVVALVISRTSKNEDLAFIIFFAKLQP